MKLNKFNLAFDHLFTIINKYIIGYSVDKDKLNNIMNSTLLHTWESNILASNKTKKQLQNSVLLLKEKMETIENLNEKYVYEKSLELIEATVENYNFAVSH